MSIKYIYDIILYCYTCYILFGINRLVNNQINVIIKLERPNYLCRETTSNQALLPSCYKQPLHVNEKSQLCFV